MKYWIDPRLGLLYYWTEERWVKCGKYVKESIIKGHDASKTRNGRLMYDDWRGPIWSVRGDIYYIISRVMNENEHTFHGRLARIRCFVMLND